MIRRFSTIRSRKLLYDILQIDKNFTDDILRKSYLRLCKKYHPDLNYGKTIKFLELVKAKDILENPLTRNKYDSMTMDEEIKFNRIWEIQFDINKEIGLDITKNINEYITLSSEINRFLISITQRIYNRIYQPPILYESNNEISGKYTHICIILDASKSMYCVDKEKQTYMNRCINNINEILSDLIKKETNQIVSLRCFAKYSKVINGYYGTSTHVKDILIENNNIFLEGALNKYILDGKTAIYDALYSAINGADKAFLKETLFILFTDGEDNSSYMSVNGVIKEIKNNPINLVIMTLNLENVSELKEFVDAAKFGKLLRIGDKFDIPNISQAFSITKDIILTKKEDNEMDSYNGITKIFNL